MDQGNKAIQQICSCHLWDQREEELVGDEFRVSLVCSKCQSKAMDVYRFSYGVIFDQEGRETGRYY